MRINDRAITVQSNCDDEWAAEERGARIIYKDRFCDERVVEQFLEPGNRNSGTFSLYYFIKDRTDGHETNDRTILFISGGPGEIVWSGGENFVDLDGYRVVYFHLRGSGFSQLPKSVKFDKYLRTEFAVNDIDKIREDLGIKKWRGIIGHSYGSVVGQRYAKEYGKTHRLILSAPLSRHDLTKVRETLQFKSLQEIYDSKYFDFLDQIARPVNGADIRQIVVREAERVSNEVDKQFGSIQFVVDTYAERKKDLLSLNLDYGLAFFRALRRLRQTGWLDIDDNLAPGSDLNVNTSQQACGLVIGKAILEKWGITENSFLEAFANADSDLSVTLETVKTDYETAERLLNKIVRQGTPRVYVQMSIFDGINVESLQQVEQVKSRAGTLKNKVESVLAKYGGEKWEKNQYLKKINVQKAKLPVPWNPAKFAHAVPTLILKGGADPVTEGNQAEYVFEKGLTGERLLIEFPGVGHAMTLPAVDDDRVVKFRVPKSETVTEDNAEVKLRTREALMRYFLEEQRLDEFKNHKIIRAIEEKFKNLFAASKRHKDERVIVCYRAAQRLPRKHYSIKTFGKIYSTDLK